MPPSIQLPRLTARSRVTNTVTSLSHKLEPFARSIAQKVRFLFEAVSLGLIKPSEIEKLVEYTYKSHPDYYKRGSYKHTWEEEIVPHLKEITSARKMLLAFCGQGRDAFLLARHGYQIVAIDREEFMIDGAVETNKELDLDIDFKVANFDSFESEPFDIVFPSIWMFTTYPSKQRRLEFLKQCRKLLTADGTLVISYRRQTKPSQESLRYLITKVVALVTRGNTTVQKGDRLTHGIFWHYFTEPEVEDEFREAGFKTLYHKTCKNGFIEWKILKPA